jgi:hypothetical protein
MGNGIETLFVVQFGLAPLLIWVGILVVWALWMRSGDGR